MSLISTCLSKVPCANSSTTNHLPLRTRRGTLSSVNASPSSTSIRSSGNGRLFLSRKQQHTFQRSALCVRATEKPSAVNGDVGNDLEAFERTVKRRYTNKVYDKTRAIPAGLLEKCLGLCLRAPTSFNTQPYHNKVLFGALTDQFSLFCTQIALVVDDEKSKQALSECMLGQGNIDVCHGSGLSDM
eukprot:1195186-Prorocentrum_minimum.AAC.1